MPRTAPPAGREEAEVYRRLEREWQEEVGRDLLDVPHRAPGTAEVFARQFERVAQALDLTRAGVVVEIGCGKGHLLEHLRRRSAPGGPTFVGIDISTATLAVRERGFSVVRGDGERLPIGDSRLSALIYDGALHHLIDYPAGLRDAYRALAPGGRLVLFEPVSSPFSRLVHRILDPLVFRKVEYESPIDQRYKDDFTEDRIIETLDELGMAWMRARSDFLAYPLTGCYADSGFGRSRRLMRTLLVAEAWIAKIPVLRRVAEIISWRLLIVAEKS